MVGSCVHLSTERRVDPARSRPVYRSAPSIRAAQSAANQVCCRPSLTMPLVADGGGRVNHALLGQLRLSAWVAIWDASAGASAVVVGLAVPAGGMFGSYPSQTDSA